jgi:hypothetical protein
MLPSGSVSRKSVDAKMTLRPGGKYDNEGCMFHTSMGVPEDFKDKYFIRLLGNATFWTAKTDAETLKRLPCGAQA